MKKILRRLMAGALVVAAVAGAWALSSCSHDDEPPAQTQQLFENVKESVWKIEGTAGNPGVKTVEFLRIYERKTPINPDAPGLKYSISGDFFEAVSEKDGVVYYNAPFAPCLGSVHVSSNLIWVVLNSQYLPGYTGYGYNVAMDIYIQSMSDKKMKAFVRRGDQTRPYDFPMITGDVTMVRSSVAEMEAFIEQTQNKGTDGFALLSN